LIYDNVKSNCNERKIPISQLEKELGFPRSSICKWNDNEPGVGKVKKILKNLLT